MDESCQIRSLIEKPKTNEHGNLINAGVYVISKDLLSYVNYGFSDFARDVFPILVQNCKVGGFFHDGYWSDIGAIGDYYAANFTMRHGGFFPFVETDAQGYDGLSEGGEYSFDSSVHSDVVNSIVGTGACIKHGSVVEQCIIMPCCTVDGKYKNSIVGNGYCVAIEPKVVSQTFSTKYNNISL